jgi:putative salt-induced outer membrane protein YdiY
MTPHSRWAALLIALAAAPAFADQITLKNGDRLTGAIVKSDAKELIFKSDLAGEVKIAWDSVAAVTASSVYVGVKGGQVAVGELALSGGAAEVRTAQTGVVKADRANVEYIRSRQEQTTFERYVNPRIGDLWAGYVDLGLSVTRGNAVTSNLATGAQAIRKTNRDKIDVHFTSVYASNRTSGLSLVTANAIRGGVAYNLNLSPDVFAFASTDLEYDEFQGLDLRVAPAGGLGWHAWKTDRGRFDVNAGASLDREFFIDGVTRTSGEALLGQESFYKLNSRVSLAEKLAFFPNLTDRGAYRLNFDASLNTAMWKWLGWQFSVSDRLLSDPLPGRKKNDLLFTTGIRLTFAR